VLDAARPKATWRAALEVCSELKVPILARRRRFEPVRPDCGAGAVIDYSKHLNRVLGFDKQKRTAEVHPCRLDA